ncbi:MAG: isoleucine--tRNA ligase [Polyangiaceae bacterium]
MSAEKGPAVASTMDPKPAFAAVPTELDFPKSEAEILAFWKANRIFEKTLTAETRATGPSKGTFVFYEGPPTANGMPHNGHVLTRAVKDVFPRYKTMQGYDVPRKAGWDTHGLPVEVEVEKELRIHGKADIEKYGVEPFTHRCIESVFRYTEAWEKLTDKIGFWVDLPSAYVTYHQSYVESVWWSLSELFKKGLLYKGHKVVWWWAQGGTALSSGEVGQGYKTVDDPSVFVAFPLEDGSADDVDVAHHVMHDKMPELLVWTTTPWTLPSNMYAAVHPEFEYAYARFVFADGGERTLVLASKLVDAVAKKLKLAGPPEILRTVKGTDLVGKKYVPPFDTYRAEGRAHKETHAVIAADFVVMDASGIVHVAPAFGEDDANAHAKLKKDDPALPLFCAVGPDGKFTSAVPKHEGRWVKDCDKDLQAELKERGLLVHAEIYRHEYPFCWRSDQDPLIQYARPAWYIRTTAENKAALENNQAINWLPDHIKDGRFGDFLRNNVDWALSRERYWGTPLNVWVNDVTGALDAPASVAEILERNPKAFEAFDAALAKDRSLSPHLRVHKPWIDQVTWTKAGEEGVYRRVPDVIDCWYDSGCMPFAQWGYPHAPGSKALFEKAFPADFISEAIDQTRGWFYSLLMISTLVFDAETQKRMGLSFPRPFPHPYKTCVVLGHVCDKEGKKESKSKGNYTPPDIILERVRMEFAVNRTAFAKAAAGAVGRANEPEPASGVAYVAREDYEGLDFTGEAARVRLRVSAPEPRGLASADGSKTVELELRPTKTLPRRILAMCAGDVAALGVAEGPKGIDVAPVEVPRLEAAHRVWVEDPSSTAPGADAFRWFFYASSPSWTNTRHALTNVRLEQKEFLVKLRNVFSFFTIYARIDGFDPSRGNASATGVDAASLAKSDGYRPVAQRSELDRWMLSELARASREVTKELDSYHLYDAARVLTDLTESLSNWYVRRSRARFWAHGSFADGTVQPDKADAYFTLYEVLVTMARLIAPFTPFFAEELWQNLGRGPWLRHGGTVPESVHLVAYPTWDEARIAPALARDMAAVREAVSLGQKVRANHRLKVRQPLSRADVVVNDRAARDALASHVGLIAEELNVHEVRLLEPGQEGDVVSYVLKPNFKALGPKLGKKVQVAKGVLAKADAAKLFGELTSTGVVKIDLEGEPVELGPEEVQVSVEAKPGFAAAGGKLGVVALDCQLTDALKDEGLGREILARVQGIRKDLGLEFTARIALALKGSERATRVALATRALFESEALVARLDVTTGELPAQAGATEREISVDGEPLVIRVSEA